MVFNFSTVPAFPVLAVIITATYVVLWRSLRSFYCVHLSLTFKHHINMSPNIVTHFIVVPKHLNWNHTWEVILPMQCLMTSLTLVMCSVIADVMLSHSSLFYILVVELWSYLNLFSSLCHSCPWFILLFTSLMFQPWKTLYSAKNFKGKTVKIFNNPFNVLLTSVNASQPDSVNINFH